MAVIISDEPLQSQQSCRQSQQSCRSGRHVFHLAKYPHHLSNDPKSSPATRHFDQWDYPHHSCIKPFWIKRIDQCNDRILKQSIKSVFLRRIVIDYCLARPETLVARKHPMRTRFNFAESFCLQFTSKLVTRQPQEAERGSNGSET